MVQDGSSTAICRRDEWKRTRRGPFLLCVAGVDLGSSEKNRPDAGNPSLYAGRIALTPPSPKMGEGIEQ